ncbi:MAG: PAS domain-containing protein, partial [Actinobacteria bacterium]|nr:PAS domain-containing protein [Actinomycetota bacterium]
MNQDTTANGPAPELDYQRLFDTAPSPFLVLDAYLTIVAVNEAYLAATATDRSALLRRPIFEAFPDNPDDPTADGVRNLRRSLETVLATGQADTMALQRYDIPIDRNDPSGHFVERYWSPINTPVIGSNGQITHIIHRVEDVTEFVRLHKTDRNQHEAAQLQMRAERMET